MLTEAFWLALFIFLVAVIVFLLSAVALFVVAFIAALVVHIRESLKERRIARGE